MIFLSYNNLITNNILLANIILIMKCKNCGQENTDDSKFCSSCGQMLKNTTESKNMILALVISFILTGLGIAYAGNRKKGIIIFVIGIIFTLLGRTVPLFAIIGILIWAYGLYCTYNEVKIANGESNPNLIEDWKGWNTNKKIISAIVMLIIVLIVVSTVIGTFAPKTTHEIKDTTPSNSNYSSISSSSGSGYSSSSSDGHDVSYHYDGKEGSSDTHGKVYDDGSVESHQTGHTKYGDYQIDSYMDSDGNVHGSVQTGGKTYRV